MLDSTELPDAVSEYIENYIASVAGPVEAAAQSKGKKMMQELSGVKYDGNEKHTSV